MKTPHPSLSELDDFLRNELNTDRYPDTEQGGIYYPSERPVHRIGLSLEPFSTLSAWIDENHIDALWLHRPWQLNLATLPPDIGILAHHLPFDETLTIGYNQQLASQLGATQLLEPLGYKQAANEIGELLPERPIGMVFDIPEQEFDSLLHRISTLFGGYDRAEAGPGPGGWQPDSNRIAVVGAMTDALVREAADEGAHLYVTGAYRKPAQQAVDETGIAVVAVGHRRVEEWGLRALADLLHERWEIDCFVHE
ncbi:Nif3-like dinuclear metal center hexameric protein [Spirosoma validum]|uniref:Nif3-like dinuclear metal center hexameric protein n=1 Tax=Spirosoma validum TaxID=2771355 RepID=A0A927B669_9BACT|nr:Nif3-like dinuclear metal center hexameric protein [Spirosoma validum]MBD2756119.1 Nif3-like dinuclear metal center hexameric protein [Spirosoma validum]